jgi:hypothetical protein
VRVLGVSRAVGVGAAVIATGALACGVCCVLPFALPAAALAISGGVLAWFGGSYPLATMIGALAVLGGWGWVGLQTMRARRRPARSTVVVMTLATLILVLALAWPGLEGWIAGLLRR